MGELRASLVRDIHDHPLAWAIIVAGAITATILWASIAGLPIVHEAPYDVPAQAAAIVRGCPPLAPWLTSNI